jgi:hypothetical protein
MFQTIIKQYFKQFCLNSKFKRWKKTFWGVSWEYFMQNFYKVGLPWIRDRTCLFGIGLDGKSDFA